jgi:hypothetical protein
MSTSVSTTLTRVRQARGALTLVDPTFALVKSFSLVSSFSLVTHQALSLSRYESRFHFFGYVSTFSFPSVLLLQGCHMSCDDSMGCTNSSAHGCAKCKHGFEDDAELGCKGSLSIDLYEHD